MLNFSENNVPAARSMLTIDVTVDPGSSGHPSPLLQPSGSLFPRASTPSPLPPHSPLRPRRSSPNPVFPDLTLQSSLLLSPSPQPHTHPLSSPARCLTPSERTNCYRKSSLDEQRFVRHEKHKAQFNNSESVPYENLNMDYIAQLTREGYTHDAVIRALGITRNDVEMACDILHEFATKRSTGAT